MNFLIYKIISYIIILLIFSLDILKGKNLNAFFFIENNQSEFY